MAIRTTNREITRNYGRVIRIGYCNAQFLFRDSDAMLYTHGVYGWNANAYIYPELNAAVVTGYRPCGNIRPDADLVHEYDERARRQVYEERNYDLRPLQLEFIKRVLNNN